MASIAGEYDCVELYICELDSLQTTTVCSESLLNMTYLQTIGGCLQTTREPDQVRADTEGGTLACRNTHRRAYSVKNGEDNRGEDGQGGDLIHGQGLAGDEQGRGSDNETLNQILDDTVDNFGDSGVHLYTC